MTQTRFETFDVPATFVATQAACEYSFTATAEREISRGVKENLSNLSLDYDTVHKSIEEFDKKKTFELPDRSVISVGAGSFRCVEVLFQPRSRIHDTSFQYIMKYDIYIRKDLYDNVVLSGGTTIFPRMVGRMTNELKALAPSTMRSRYGLEDLSCVRAPRRKHHHCRSEHFLLRKYVVPAKFLRYTSQRIPRHVLLEQHER